MQQKEKKEKKKKKKEHCRSVNMMLLTLIDRALTRLFDSLERTRTKDKCKRRKTSRRGRMHVSINHDLNQISTSARAPIDNMEK